MPEVDHPLCTRRQLIRAAGGLVLAPAAPSRTSARPDRAADAGRGHQPSGDCRRPRSSRPGTSC